MRTAILLFAVLTFLTIVQGAKILALFGFSTQSHNNVFSALTKELAVRGHDLTVVTPYPIKNPNQNYRQIEISEVRKIVSENTDFAESDMISRIKKMYKIFIYSCPLILQSDDVKALLNEQFDLILISISMNDCCLPFVHHFKTPFIFISPAGLTTYTSTAIGNPDSASFIPNLFLPYTDHMNFWQRSINFIFGMYVQALHDLILKPSMNAAAREFFGNHVPSVQEIVTNASLVLINNHVSLNYPRPLNPNVIEVGGMHFKQKTDPLPKDIQVFLDDAKDGAIYFSMGSLLRSENIPKEKIQEILETFTLLKQRVLWKWESDELPAQSTNIKFGKWLPQQDILAHPNVKLFITHGGLLSTQESLYHGVPLVGIPIFSDQELNMKRSQDLGFALTVDYKNISKAMLPAIQTVLADPSFANAAQTLMRRMRDQPETPLERAVFWTEYVLRHNGAYHLRSAATQLSWYQLYMLDFAAFVIILMLLSLLIIRTGRVLTRRMKPSVSPCTASHTTTGKKDV